MTGRRWPAAWTTGRPTAGDRRVPRGRTNRGHAARPAGAAHHHLPLRRAPHHADNIPPRRRPHAGHSLEHRRPAPPTGTSTSWRTRTSPSMIGDRPMALATPTEGADRDRVWTMIKGNYPFFAEREESHQRTIPVVALSRGLTLTTDQWPRAIHSSRCGASAAIWSGRRDRSGRRCRRAGRAAAVADRVDDGREVAERPAGRARPAVEQRVAGEHRASSGRRGRPTPGEWPGVWSTVS